MRALLAVTSLSLIVAGCSSSPATPTGSTSTGSTGSTTSTSGGTGGATASSTSASTGSGGSAWDAGGPITTYTTGEGPIALQPGEEQTNCITIHLGNAQGGYVRRVTADLDPGSHHMIVYKSSDTTESPTPTKCYGLEGILNGQHPFFIAQQAHAQLDWPDDGGDPVGFEIGPNQMVHIEFHTINTTAAPIMVTGKALIDTIPLDTPNIIQSDMAFWGTRNIDILPMSSFDTGVQYQDGLPGTKSFAVTTHQHHLGTQMQVWYASSRTDTTNRIANGLSWSDPPLNLLNPPIEFPADGSKLITYDCHWENTTTSEVQFGESFNDEMCFLWHYYYPSQGFQACIDHLCTTNM